MSFRGQHQTRDCRVCGAPTRGGKTLCTLHSPKRTTTPHWDKYDDKKLAAAAEK